MSVKISNEEFLIRTCILGDIVNHLDNSLVFLNELLNEKTNQNIKSYLQSQAIYENRKACIIKEHQQHNADLKSHCKF